MKAFTKDGVTYRVRQRLVDGIQYSATYNDCTESWAFIAGKRHTRAQVIESINEVNFRKNEESSDDWDD